jgi:hypothetical protein
MADYIPALAFPATILAVEVLLRLDLGSTLARYRATVRQSTALMRDATLGDDDKQARMARASGEMLTTSLRLFAIILLALGAYVGAIWSGGTALGADGGGWGAVMRVDLQIVSILLALAWLRVRTRVVV